MICNSYNQNQLQYYSKYPQFFYLLDVAKTYLNIWDLATLGSPINMMLISPLSLVPFGRTFSSPPKSWHKRAFFTYSWPWIDGAKDRAKMLKILFFSDLANFLHLATSSPEIVSSSCCFNWTMLLANKMVRNVPKKKKEIWFILLIFK